VELRGCKEWSSAGVGRRGQTFLFAAWETCTELWSILFDGDPRLSVQDTAVEESAGTARVELMVDVLAPGATPRALSSIRFRQAATFHERGGFQPILADVNVQGPYPPTGFVEFSINGSVIDRVPVTTDKFSFANGTLPPSFPAGQYTITAYYTGDEHYLPSRDAATVVIREREN
jgi:hypothetical protein